MGELITYADVLRESFPTLMTMLKDRGISSVYSESTDYGYERCLEWEFSGIYCTFTYNYEDHDYSNEGYFTAYRDGKKVTSYTAENNINEVIEFIENFTKGDE